MEIFFIVKLTDAVKLVVYELHQTLSRTINKLLLVTPKTLKGEKGLFWLKYCLCLDSLHLKRQVGGHASAGRVF